MSPPLPLLFFVHSVFPCPLHLQIRNFYGEFVSQISSHPRCALSPDSLTVYTTCQASNSLLVYDVPSQKLLHKLPAHTKSMVAISPSFSPSTMHAMPTRSPFPPPLPMSPEEHDAGGVPQPRPLSADQLL